MEKLPTIIEALMNEFRIESYGPDAGFSRFIPAVYEPIKFDWKHFFEDPFTKQFNGLMIKGDENIGTVFLAYFQQMRCWNAS